jgi:ribulose-bisphosphate carboxylase large chain
MVVGEANSETGAARPEFTARYLVESPYPLERTAEVIAGEQSCGTFVALPGETDELRARARARVLSITPIGASPHPALASAHGERRGIAGPFHRGEIEIAFPVDNVGANLPTLLATVAGNLFELGEVTGAKLLDLDFPQSYARGFPGPAFGVEGTREQARVPEGPLIGTIIKPSVGLSPADTAALVDTLCAAGIDFIKDDELMGDPPHAPLAERVKAVMPVVERHADRSGRKAMFAFNISASVDDMRRHYDRVASAGGTCVMVSLNWVGFAAVEHLRRHGALPIHGHRNGWGALTRHPLLGFAYAAYQKLWRLAGVDQLHVNGLRNKFWEPDESVIASARSCLAAFAGMRPIMPVFSSGQSAEQPPDTYKALGCTDLLYLAGGGISAHPLGPAAGVESLRQAWEAAIAGENLESYARTRPSLAAALSAFRAPPISQPTGGNT